MIKPKLSLRLFKSLLNKGKMRGRVMKASELIPTNYQTVSEKLPKARINTPWAPEDEFARNLTKGRRSARMTKLNADPKFKNDVINRAHTSMSQLQADPKFRAAHKAR